MKVAFSPSSIMEAIIRTYDGPLAASVQFDPPVYRGDGRWFVWLMVNDDSHRGQGFYSIAGGSGPTDFEALVSLAHMRGLEIETPDITCDVCDAKIEAEVAISDHKFPGGLTLVVCASKDCHNHLRIE